MRTTSHPHPIPHPYEVWIAVWFYVATTIVLSTLTARLMNM